MGRASWVALATACVLAALAPAAAVAAPPGGTGTGPNCGLPCQPKATVTINPIAAGPFGPLEHVGFMVGFQVTNASLNDITATPVVSVTGQSAPTPSSFASVTLHPGDHYDGAFTIADPKDGDTLVTVNFRTAIVCRPRLGKTGPRNCSGGQVLASASTGVTVAPDKDLDGLSDTLEAHYLATYAPLLLFSNDHNSQEQYAPIDVLAFIQKSSLVSKDSAIPSLSTLQTPGLILDPTGNGKDLGAITNSQAIGSLPRQIYVNPSEQAQHGDAWPDVLAKKNVGLYGHVTLLRVDEITDTTLEQHLAQKYCDAPTPCSRTVVKIEYWQFFGYSHDFEVPASPPGTPLALLAGDLIDHGGDWCTVQLFIDPLEAKPDKAILAVYHFAHGLDFLFDLTQPYAGGPIAPGSSDNPTAYDFEQLQGANMGKPVDLPITGGRGTAAWQNAQNNVLQLARANSLSPYVHPVVYVEWGGHEFWPTSAWSLKYVSNHNGAGYSYFAAPPPNLGEIGRPMPGVAQAPLVTGFGGFWGYYGWENQNKPPPGPILHAEWLWLAGGPVSNAERVDPPF